MRPAVHNIFSKVSKAAAREEFLTLFENGSGKIERIVSHSHSSPAGFWYDQETDEWVMVLRGSAVLEFEGGDAVELQEGDYLTIGKHVKHRVASTSATTVWLAVHVK
ncbi:MAG TPA: cupin domain-containing protein [Candidatus Binatia bacterium]|nr:cupin domain-containing protein [Candidatus Binatia bacterium]